MSIRERGFFVNVTRPQLTLLFSLIRSASTLLPCMEALVGRLMKSGQRILRDAGLDPASTPDRLALVLGTGWSDPAVLVDRGFVPEQELTFQQVGIAAGNGAGHPNKFLLGTWHDRKVVISQGRVHLYQERAGMESLIRRWMSVLLALKGAGTRIVITSSVGGISATAKTGTVVQPTTLVSAHLPMPYLNGAEAEFVMSEHLLWLFHKESGVDRPLIRSTFTEAAARAGLNALDRGVHIMIPGPGFGGAFERRLWKSWGSTRSGCRSIPNFDSSRSRTWTTREAPCRSSRPSSSPTTTICPAMRRSPRRPKHAPRNSARSSITSSPPSGRPSSPELPALDFFKFQDRQKLEFHNPRIAKRGDFLQGRT